jgi:hypothetical protein
MNGLRKLATAMVTEGMYQQAVAKGFQGGREMFVTLGLHQVSRNVAAYAVMWKAMGELNAHKAVRR